MAFDFRDSMYSNSRSNHDSPRWFEDCQDEWQDIPSCHCSNWTILQSFTYLLQSSIPLFIRRIHSNAQGIWTLEIPLMLGDDPCCRSSNYLDNAN